MKKKLINGVRYALCLIPFFVSVTIGCVFIDKTRGWVE